MDDNEKIKEEIVDALIDTQTLLLIGSGVSCWSALPSWRNILVELQRYCREEVILSEDQLTNVTDFIDKPDYETAADIMQRNMSLDQWVNFWTEYHEFREALPTGIHSKIMSLGPKNFITNNYDDLIEKAAIQYGLAIKVITNNDLGNIQEIQHASSSNFVYKYHGSIHDPETIVLSKKLYAQLIHEKPHVRSALINLQTSRSVVILGCGLEDRDLQLIHEVIASYGGQKITKYAIMPNSQPNDFEGLRDNYGLNILPYDLLDEGNGDNPHGNFERTIDELLSMIIERRRSNITPSLRDDEVKQGALDVALHDNNADFKEIDSAIVAYSYSLKRASKVAIHAMLRSDDFSDADIAARGRSLIHGGLIKETENMYLGVKSEASIDAASKFEDDLIQKYREENDG